jgi:hypothetical protein
MADFVEDEQDQVAEALLELVDALRTQKAPVVNFTATVPAQATPDVTVNPIINVPPAKRVETWVFTVTSHDAAGRIREIVAESR